MLIILGSYMMHGFKKNLNEKVSVLTCLYNLNSEFDVIETAGLFINSSHGIGPDYS